MNKPTARRPRVILVLVALWVAAACAGPDGSATPVASGSSAQPTIVVSPSPNATASPAPTLRPTPRPTCPPIKFATFVASDRLTDAKVAPGTGGDLVGFVLDPSPGSPIRPRLTVSAVEPPFVADDSGLPLEIAGEHHVWLSFEGMVHVDDAGNIVYGGPRTQPGIGGPVQQVELTEAFESYVSFIVGYDGEGCVGLQVTPTLITVAIEAR